MKPLSAPPASPIQSASLPARACSPNGLTRKATARNAAPPNGSPVTNRTTDPTKTKNEAMLKNIADAAWTNAKNAAVTVKSNANGAASIFKIILISITQPITSELYIHIVMLTWIERKYKSYS